MIVDLNVTNGSTADRVNQPSVWGLLDKTQAKLSATFPMAFNAVLKLKSSWLIEPVHHIVHLVSRRICVLPGELFARDARRTCVSSPFCNDKILVGARRNFVMDLIITYKVVCSRGDNEYWNRDMLKVIISGVVVRRHVEIVGALSPYRPY
jgi:hypothetical protein